MDRPSQLLGIVFVVVIVAFVASVIHLYISTTKFSKQIISGTTIAKGYVINNNLNLSALVKVVNATYTVYIILTNEGNKTLNYTLFGYGAINYSDINGLCSSLVSVKIAKGYYMLSNLTSANFLPEGSLFVCTYPLIARNVTINLYPKVPIIYYMYILGNPFLYSPSEPLKPGIYTIVVKDVFNQTLILHVNFPTYVGDAVYYSNHGVYLTTAFPVKEVELINGDETEIFKVKYISPFNGVIFLNVTINLNWDYTPLPNVLIEVNNTWMHLPYLKVLVNNTWVTYGYYYENEALNLTYSGIASPKETIVELQ